MPHSDQASITACVACSATTLAEQDDKHIWRTLESVEALVPVYQRRFLLLSSVQHRRQVISDCGGPVNESTNFQPSLAVLPKT